jgi:hypothetical protein
VRRADFEHVIRAAARIVDDELVVIGSQAVLAQYPDAPAALLVSLEVDLYPRNHPDPADEIYDLVLAKLAAGRPHDFAFAEQAIRSALVDADQLLLGVDLMPQSHRERTRERLVGLLAR